MSTAAVRKRVLVVDDDAVYRELLSIGLGAGGYEILVAENGIEAKKIVGAEAVDAVIVDMLMPLMDGLRFIDWLRKEARNEVPVLVLTSVDDRALSVEAMVAGATDVVVKPVGLPQLTQRLGALLAS